MSKLQHILFNISNKSQSMRSVCFPIDQFQTVIFLWNINITSIFGSKIQQSQIMISKLSRFIFLIVIPAFLVLITLSAYNYSQSQRLFQTPKIEPIPYDQYRLQKTNYWKNRFDFLTDNKLNQVRRKIAGSNDNVLEVRRGQQKYHIFYQYQVDVNIIQSVHQVHQDGDQTQYSGRYFLIKYPKLVEIVYFDLTKNLKPQNHNQRKEYEAEVCFELPLESTQNVKYHIDSFNNIWIVTVSMNKVIFVQIYSCSKGYLIKQYRYSLGNLQFINGIYKVTKGENNCMQIQTITYSLNRVDIQVCPDSINQTIKQKNRYYSNQLIYQNQSKQQWSSYSISKEQTQTNQFWKIINHILASLNIQFRFKVNLYQQSLPIENVYEHFDTIAIDQQNNYLINFSKNKTATGILSLDKYLTNTKTPLFHNNPHYDPYGVMDLLNSQSQGKYNPEYFHKYIQPTHNETKKVSYKAAYQTFPSFKVQYIGFGEKALIFWPEQNLQQKDFLAIRTRTGALVSQKTQLKGVHDKLPLALDEVKQRIDDKPRQVYPGLYQLHAMEQSLISKPAVYQRLQQYGKIQLVSLINTKVLFTHYVRVKQGFRYISSFLLNNQWWILEYNREKKVSQAKKYELFVQASKTEKIYSLEMVYGNLTSIQHLNGQDQLSALMAEFVAQHQNGYMFLNIYRCVDQYYYIQYTDADQSVYGVARIHFKNLSNRRVRKGKDYSENFYKKVMVQEKNMLPAKYSLKSYAVALKNIQVFKHLSYLIKPKAVLNNTWSSYCSQGVNFRKLNKLDRYYYYPQVHYGIGEQGCNYNSDESYNQTFFSFNMRNLIIQGKINDQKKIVEYKKNAVYFILSWLPTYLILIAVLYAIQINRKNETAEDQKKKNASMEKKKQ